MNETPFPETSLELVTLANHNHSFSNTAPILTTRPVKARWRNFILHNWHFSQMAISGGLVQIKNISLVAYIINQYRFRFFFCANWAPFVTLCPIYLIGRIRPFDTLVLLLKGTIGKWTVQSISWTNCPNTTMKVLMWYKRPVRLYLYWKHS